MIDNHSAFAAMKVKVCCNPGLPDLDYCTQPHEKKGRLLSASNTSIETSFLDGVLSLRIVKSKKPVRVNDQLNEIELNIAKVHRPLVVDVQFQVGKPAQIGPQNKSLKPVGSYIPPKGKTIGDSFICEVKGA